MLGVAVLIIVTSVFSGFHLQLKKSFFQFSADLTVRPMGGPIVEYETLADRIAKIPGVTGVSPIIGGKVMIETDPEIGAPAFDAPVLLGVDPDRMKTPRPPRLGQPRGGEWEIVLHHANGRSHLLG